MNILFNPATPQLFASLDHAKVFKLGLSTKDVYGTLQALLGGLYVNQFNRFGRVWKVFVEAEPAYRLKIEDVGQFYVRNKSGAMVPLSTLVDLQKASGPEFTTRFNEYRSIEVFGSPARGYSAGQAMNAITQVANQVLPRDMGIAWNGMSYQQAQAGGAAGVFRTLADVRIPDPRGSVRKLVAPVQRAVEYSGRGVRCVFRTMGAQTRQRHLRANRPHHVNRAIGEERHPDRGIRAR